MAEKQGHIRKAGWSALAPATRLTLLLAALASAGAALFVMIYPHVFKRIERMHPDHYKENVAEALAGGDLKRAIASAAYAARWYSLEPDVFATWGELLAQDGQTEAAQTQFRHALGLTATPDYRPTRKPFFHAKARLGLGVLSLNEGAFLPAISHYELGRAYSDLAGAEYAEYHKDLYGAYAHEGLWGRALAFGLPEPDELATLNEASLRVLMEAANAREQWDLALRAARALIARAPGDGAAHFIAGRIHMAKGDAAAAQTEWSEAARGNHPDAPFFLGLLEQRAKHLDDAISHFRQTAPASLYRAFALGRMIELTGKPGGPALSPAERKAIGAELRNLIATACGIRVRPAPPARRHTQFEIAAVRAPAGHVAGSVPFPVLTKWTRRVTSQKRNSGIRVREGQRGSYTLEAPEDILNLQWVSNRILFGGFEGLVPGMTDIPGWFEPQRDWEKKDASAGTVTADAEGNGVLRMTNPGGTAFPRINTAPVRLKPGACYLFMGQVHAPAAKAVLGWEFLDREGRPEAGHNVMNQTVSPQWTWRAASTRASVAWESVWIVAGVYPEAGTADFDNIMLFELAQP